MRWLAVIVFLLAAPAYSQTPVCSKITFEDGFKECWAEQHGPQFLFAWSEDDVATLRRAFDNLAAMHDHDPRGINDYLMGRRARILGKLEHRTVLMYGMFWDLDLVDATGKPWRLQAMSLPETILSGFAVLRDRYCRAEDQDVDDWHYLDAVTICEIHNTAAKELYARTFEHAHHEISGGATFQANAN
jgi:hypothetical protein